MCKKTYFFLSKLVILGTESLIANENCCVSPPIYCMTGWLMDELTDGQRQMDGRTDRQTEGQTDWLTYELTDWRANRLTEL